MRLDEKAITLDHILIFAVADVKPRLNRLLSTSQDSSHGGLGYKVRSWERPKVREIFRSHSP